SPISRDRVPVARKTFLPTSAYSGMWARKRSFRCSHRRGWPSIRRFTKPWRSVCSKHWPAKRRWWRARILDSRFRVAVFTPADLTGPEWIAWTHLATHCRRFLTIRICGAILAAAAGHGLKPPIRATVSSNRLHGFVSAPERNRRALLAEAIATVFDQTFADWELLVVDDCSSDDTQLYLDRVK